MFIHLFAANVTVKMITFDKNYLGHDLDFDPIYPRNNPFNSKHNYMTESKKKNRSHAEEAAFVDALRSFLGLEPLYSKKHSCDLPQYYQSAMIDVIKPKNGHEIN